MNYPIWVVPYLGGPWVIGIMAIIHIFISHFAVGGGAFLALAEELAYKRKDDRIYQYLKDHSRFFVLVTTVAGAATGVGIWFTISLVSPDGTGSLIQIFTLAWALEYLFFSSRARDSICLLLHMGQDRQSSALKNCQTLFYFFVFYSGDHKWHHHFYAHAGQMDTKP